MKHIACLCFLLSFFICFSADAQLTSKPISRLQLVHYLSRAINISGFSDFCKTPKGAYPGPVNDYSKIVSDAEMAARPSDRHDSLMLADMRSGKHFERYQDLLRLIRKVKPKLIADAITQWGGSTPWPPWEMDWRVYLNRALHTVRDVKAIDSEIIIQAAVNEFVDGPLLNAIGNIPEWVFAAFDLPPEKRKFDKQRMVFADYATNAQHHWYGDAIVPDISKPESKMFFYYLGVTYIDIGCESLQFSQVELMNNGSDDPANWNEVFQRLRSYASGKSDIRFLLITGHTNGFRDSSGRLSFDYHSSPVRLSESSRAIHENGGGCYIDAQQCWAGKGKIYKSSLGGITPSGWTCDELPGLVFLDNWGPDVAQAGRPAGDGCNQYHWDEISWFAMQPGSYRNEWLRYAAERVRHLDTNVWFILPVKRVVVCNNRDGLWSVDYLANNTSMDTTLLPAPKTIGDAPDGPTDRYSVQLFAGYGQENVIRDIISDTALGRKYFPPVPD